MMKRLKRQLSSVAAGLLTLGRPDWFLSAAPAPQLAVDIFKGSWASAIPLDGVLSGNVDLFHDHRIDWWLKQVGGVVGQSLIELGPLEGAHTWMLEKAGAASVVAIESNTQAYLKCLVTNALLGMKRAEFLAGDFMAYLEQPGPSFDAAIACGVLYHLRDPQRLFHLLAKRCRGPVLLWTQYWAESIATSHPGLHRLLGPERVVTTASGIKLRLHRHSYRATRFGRSFWGGNASYSEWLDRSSLEAAIGDAGYDIAATTFDDPNHPNGPAVAMTLKPRMPR